MRNFQKLIHLNIPYIKKNIYGNNNKKHVNLLAISEKRLEVRYCYEIYIFDVAIFYIIIIS